MLVPLAIDVQSVSVAPVITLIVHRYIAYALLRADVKSPVSCLLLASDTTVMIKIRINVTVMMTTPCSQSLDQGK